jgi:iron complex outermembrane receptor protein
MSGKKIQSFVRISFSASVSVLAIMTGTQAFAQSGTAASATAPEIVDGAVPFAETSDTPIAITAVTAATLEARSQTSLTDVANQAPSVVLRPTTAAFGPAISATIRGMGQIDFNPALEPGVGLYIDDVTILD